MSATPNTATWRSSRRLLRDLLCVQCSARREYKAVEAMDETCADETPETISGVDRVVKQAGDLINCPRPLTVAVKQRFEDHGIRVRLPLRIGHGDRLVLHLRHDVARFE